MRRTCRGRLPSGNRKFNNFRSPLDGNLPVSIEGKRVIPSSSHHPLQASRPYRFFLAAQRSFFRWFRSCAPQASSPASAPKGPRATAEPRACLPWPGALAAARRPGWCASASRPFFPGFHSSAPPRRADGLRVASSLASVAPFFCDVLRASSSSTSRRYLPPSLATAAATSHRGPALPRAHFGFSAAVIQQQHADLVAARPSGSNGVRVARFLWSSFPRSRVSKHASRPRRVKVKLQQWTIHAASARPGALPSTRASCCARSSSRSRWPASSSTSTGAPSSSHGPRHTASGNFGKHDYLPEGSSGSWSTIVHHSNGLHLLEGDVQYAVVYVLYVVNAATGYCASLPPCPPPRSEMNTLEEQYLAYDPPTSQEYRVFSIPWFLGNRSEKELVQIVEQSEWPPVTCLFNMFSSSTGLWEKRSFVREGGTARVVADMRQYWASEVFIAVCGGALYVHCQTGYVSQTICMYQGNRKRGFTVHLFKNTMDFESGYLKNRVVQWCGC
ncbi:hypothetical protein EJB05_51789, partial [Eragrostis curvula]